MKRVDSHVELSAEEARQGHIVLNTPLRLAIFAGGLIGIGALVFLVAAL